MARQSTATSGKTRTAREPLSRERSLTAAVAIADAEGIESLTMRRLASELGVEAMSLYHHVANKDDVLDGITDRVVSEIEVPPSGTPWRAAMRDRAISAHGVLLAHPWAATMIMSRFNIGPGITRYLDATFGRLREGGFSIHGALDAWHTLDSHIYGFTLQELQLPFDAADNAQVSADVIELFDPTQFPYVVEVVTEISKTGRVEHFEFGLDLILDGLQRILDRQVAKRTSQNQVERR
jgi:AcrR family transcriptional regulator